MSNIINKNNGRFITIDPKERFFSHIKKLNNKCWEWQAYKDKDGYGNFSINKKFISSHRASYILFIGKIKKGLWVLHKCDNPSCVSPEHLFLGTALDNAHDRDNKERGSRGEKVNTNILDRTQVMKIRGSIKSKKELAKEFNVSIDTIYNIINRKTWKWLC